MLKIKEIIRKFDKFGVSFGFNYKSEGQFQTLSGGIIYIIFFIISIIYFIFCLTKYIQDRPMTVIYHNKELANTDKINFKYQKVGLAFKVYCDESSDNINIEDLLKMNLKLVKSIRDNKGITKTRLDKNLRKCTYNDFYNLLNNELDINLVPNNTYCFDINENEEIYGTYLEDEFFYYEITLSMINEEKNDILTKMLIEQDCKFTVYFSDHGIDVNDLENPAPIFLNQRFIQLSPINYNKLNLDFQISEFTTYADYFLDFGNIKQYVVYSKTESYTVYKGIDRYNTKVDDYEKYARIFIRADTTQMILERNYQKLTDLIAEFWSPLDLIFVVLSLIFENYDDMFLIQGIIENIYKIKEEDKFNREKFNKIMNEKMSKESLTKFNNIKNEKIKDIDINNKHKTLSSTSEIMDESRQNTEAKNDSKIIFPIIENKKTKQINGIKGKIFINKMSNIFPCINLSKESKILFDMEEIFNDQLDVFNYLKYLQKVKIMSYLMLNEEENYFFKFSSNPAIVEETPNLYDFVIDEEKRENDELDEFWNKFQKLLMKSDKTAIEEKLCKLICTNINNIIENEDNPK